MTVNEVSIERGGGIVRPRLNRTLRRYQPRVIPIGARGFGVPGTRVTPKALDASTATFRSMARYLMPSASSGIKVLRIRPVYACWDWPQDGGPQDRASTIIGAASVSRRDIAARVVQASASVAIGSNTITVNSSYGIQRGAEITIDGNSGALTPRTYVTDVEASSASAVLTLSEVTIGTIASSAVVRLTGRSYQATFGDRKELRIEPKRGYIWGDWIDIQPGPDEWLYWTTWGAVTGGAFYNLQACGGDGTSTYLSGEGTVFGSALLDTTLSAALPATQTQTGLICPCWLEAEVIGGEDVPVVAIFTDSLGHGIGDSGDPYGRVGMAQKEMRNDVPWVAMTRGGAAMNMHRVDNWSIPASLAAMYRPDFFIIGMSRNGVLAIGDSQSQAEADIANCATAVKAAGAGRVIGMTIPPFTSGSAATIEGQTIPNSGRETIRQAVNATLRTSPGSLNIDGVYDWAELIEYGPTHVWDLYQGAATTDDRTHPNANGVNKIVSYGRLRTVLGL